MVIKMEVSGSAMDLPAMDFPPTLKAAASNVYQNDAADYGASFAFDDDDQTRWATDNGTRQAWIAADFLKPQTINEIELFDK